MSKLLSFRVKSYVYELPLAAATIGLVFEALFPQAAVIAQSVPMPPRPNPVVQPTQTEEVLSFPASNVREARYIVTVPVTAYSSTPDQTDASPFITASGTQVRWGVVAANFLPMGTLVRMPDHYGDQVFVVEDRMNARYDVRLDIWMQTREAAKQWGLRRVKLEVL